MSFDYDAVKNITNQDFAMSGRMLLDKCQGIEEKYNSADLRGCCKDAREVNEIVLRYMYERLIGYRKKTPTAGDILKDIDFTSKIDDLELVMAAEEVQRIGNQYVHDEPSKNESEERFNARMKQNAERLPINTDTILEKLSIALEREIVFINEKISGVRGKLKIKFEDRISAKNGCEECVLEADLTDVVNRKDYTYIWKIQGQNLPYREKTYIITLNQPWMIGKTFVLEAVNNSTGQVLSDQYGPIEENQVILKKQKKKDNSIQSPNSSLEASTQSEIVGEVIIEKDKSYKGSGVKLQASLQNADFSLDDANVSIIWGFIGDNGNFVKITSENAQKSSSIKCSLQTKSLGRIYKCIVSSRGRQGTLEAVYRKLTEYDFTIVGEVEIKPDSKNRSLKASVKNPNYNGQPVYEWIRNGAVIEGENTRVIKITDSDIGSKYSCRISLPSQLFGTQSSAEYTVRKEDVQDSAEKKLTLSIGEHEGNKVIWAKIGGETLSKEDYSCSWSLKKDNGKESDIFYKGVHLEIADFCSGDEVFCKVMETGDNQVLYSGSYVLKDEDFVIDVPESDSQSTKSPVETPELVVEAIPHTETEPEVEVVSDHQKEIDTEPVSVHETESLSDMKVEPNPVKETTSEPNPVNEPTSEPVSVTQSEPKPSVVSELFAIEKPTEVTAPKFRCFDSNDSRLHYFIAPRNEHYCTNAFEYLDYNEFLYNLLKEHGYERVILVSNFSEGEGDDYPVLTYDAFSHRSFLKFTYYENTFKGKRMIKADAKEAFCSKYSEIAKNKASNPIRKAMGGKENTTLNHTEECSQYGRRVIKTLVKTNSASTGASDTGEKTAKEILESFIISEVNAAMKSSILKTAIVLPLEMILEREWLSPLVIRRLNEMIDRRSKNTIIVTADQREDFFSLFDGDMSNRIKGFDKDFAKAIASIQGAREPQAYCNAFVSALEEKNRILLASDRPGHDEIANYLFMMKMRQPKRFERLPFSKIYSLAEFISDHCSSREQTQETFPDLDNNTWHIDTMESLDIELDSDDILTALIDVALGTTDGRTALWDKNINIVEGLKPTSVERINGTSEILTDKKTKKRYYGTPLERYTITEAERLSITESAQSDLNEMIGLRNVKTTIQELTREAVNNAKRNQSAPEPGNYIFEGNPGTGKTEVARLMGKMLHAAGLLRKGHTVEVSASDLVGQYVGETAIKTRKKCEEALDGVLFIDEAYELVNTDRQYESDHTNSFKQDAYTALLKFMEDNRSRFCLIAAGYPNKMNAFRMANEGMMSRIPDSNVIRFDDYSTDELIQILKLMAKKKDYVILSDDFVEEARLTLEEMKAEKGDRFGNGRDVRSILAMSLRKAESRSSSETITLIREDIEANRNIRDPEAAERAWAAIDQYVGLKNIKEQLKEVVDYQRAFGIIEVDSMIFAGPPGTGKSEVAKLIAPILKAEGILKTDTFVPAPLENLIGRAQGETESKTKALCAAAENGVLFIDEAYGLINKEDRTFKSPYAEAAYTTIMRFMTEHKNHIVVIFAGYADMMDAFVKANPGMARRIKVINFEPYSDDELMEIFRRKAEVVGKRGKRIHLEFSEEFSRELKKCFPVMRKLKGNEFGNAGEIEGLLTSCSFSAAKRLGIDLERESTVILTADDIPEEYRAVENPSEKDPVDTETPQFRLIPKEEITSLSDPYDSLDIHGEAFPKFCIQSIPRIDNEFGKASAFVISPKGYAITCTHVVALKKDLGRVAKSNLIARFTFENGKEEQYPFEIINVRPDLDMALIRIIADHEFPYLAIASEDREIVFGEDCHLFGYPDGRDGILLTKGSVSSLAENGGDGELGNIYFYDGNAYPGDSGGPIIAKSDGRVIGILRGARGPRDGARHNYMKPVYYFWKEFLK